MRNLIFHIIIFVFFISCKESPKVLSNEKLKKAEVNTQNPSFENNTILKKDTIRNGSNTNALPFDFEEYTAICLQQDSPDCQKKYPILDESNFKKIMNILGNKIEDTPNNIFQIQSGFKNDLKVYVLNFEGDSSFQEIIVINKNKIVSRQSIGYAMPEEKTYTSFIINSNMEIDVYEINYESLKKKLNGKYKIFSDGKISKI